MDDFLRDTHAMEGILLHEFQENELGDEFDIIDTFFESLKYATTTLLFGHGARYTQLGTTILLYNLK